MVSAKGQAMARRRIAKGCTTERRIASSNSGFGWIGILGLALAGCVTRPSYDETLAPWVGRSVNDLLLEWGAPERTFAMPNGNLMYIFESRRRVSTPIHGYGSTSRLGQTHMHLYGGGSIDYWCRTTFYVDEKHVVTKYRWDGNDCR